jgi:hypothetical protein
MVHKDAFQRFSAHCGWLGAAAGVSRMCFWLHTREASYQSHSPAALPPSPSAASASAASPSPFRATTMSIHLPAARTPCSLLSLPLEPWYLIFDALPERPAGFFDEPPPSPLRTAGIYAVDAAALASTCSALNKFYRTCYVQAISLTRTATPALLSRALARHPSATRLLLQNITTSANITFTSAAGLLDASPAHAAQLAQFHVVNEDMNSNISKCMHSLPLLRSLTLVKCTALTGADAQMVGRVLARSLRELNLDGTELGGLCADNWRALGHLARLERLNLSRWGCAALPTCAYDAVARMRALQALTIQGDARVDAGQLQFLRTMPRLTLLDLSCCAGLSSAVWEAVPARVSVLRLDWTSALHDGCAMSNLGRLGSLVELAVGVSQQLTEWYPLGAVAVSLRELHLGESLLTDEGAAAVLSRMSGLLSLDLDQCTLVGDGVASVAARLRLERLNLCGTAVTMAGVQSVAAGAAAATLVSLDMCCCDELPDKEGAAAVLQAALVQVGASIEVW